MLDPSEQRRLREIGRALQSDDPLFADRIGARPEPASSPPAERRHLHALAIAGAVLALVGAVTTVVLVPAGLSSR